MLSKENVPSFSTKKSASASKAKDSASKRDLTPVRKFGLQSPNASNVSELSARSGEQSFYTPTGTVDISTELKQQASPDSSAIIMGGMLGTSFDISASVAKVFSDRRMTVDAATALGIINDLEKAQIALK